MSETISLRAKCYIGEHITRLSARAWESDSEMWSLTFETDHSQVWASIEASDLRPFVAELAKQLGLMEES